MAEFKKGQKVWVPSDSANGQIKATFIEVADPGEALVVSGQRRDAARVRYEEGEEEGLMGLVPYFRVRDRDA
jgi:hypothetical protein